MTDLDTGPERATRTAGGRVRSALGLAVLVVGLITAVVLWIVAAQRFDDVVSGLARAPVGCDTSLEFERTGEYTIFVETSGRIERVAGDCEIDGAFELDDDELPEVRIDLRAPEGADLTDDLVGDVSASYDADVDGIDYVGTALFVVDVDEVGEHRMRVESDVEARFAVSVGQDPSDETAALRVGAVALGLASLMAGLALLLAGRRSPGSTGRTVRPAAPSGVAPRRPRMPDGPPMTAPPSAPAGPSPAPPSRPGPPPPSGPPTRPPMGPPPGPASWPGPSSPDPGRSTRPPSAPPPPSGAPSPPPPPRPGTAATPPPPAVPPPPPRSPGSAPPSRLPDAPERSAHGQPIPGEVAWYPPVAPDSDDERRRDDVQ
ncbi:hypothetical protein [Ilumatobacter sp.]|uniref:hypothetical protein n=1 Tax=Ilumatobacter sp. TaxID=1967498 RepID=UPI003B528C45